PNLRILFPSVSKYFPRLSLATLYFSNYRVLRVNLSTKFSTISLFLLIKNLTEGLLKPGICKPELNPSSSRQILLYQS
ncbi:hypothetical protein GIB67_028694, partial [Kingdonia uniflora]